MGKPAYKSGEILSFRRDINQKFIIAGGWALQHLLNKCVSIDVFEGVVKKVFPDYKISSDLTENVYEIRIIIDGKIQDDFYIREQELERIVVITDPNNPNSLFLKKKRSMKT